MTPNSQPSATLPAHAAFPRVVSTGRELRHLVEEARRHGKRIGLVPTMGALHEGHLSLVRAAGGCDFRIVSIFVNPTQFAPHEDFDQYPRMLERDIDQLARESVDLVFAPSIGEVYPEGCTTTVNPPSVALPWEGRLRPDHFRGVCTVVLKLLQLCQPDQAFFGQKDYQQCRVVQRMVEDLNVPVQIVICPTVREPDGLAMSSRNRYLPPDARWQALALREALQSAKAQVGEGVRQTREVCERMRLVLADRGVRDVDYATVVRRADLTESEFIVPGEAVALVAARVSSTRLIDNCEL